MTEKVLGQFSRLESLLLEGGGGGGDGRVVGKPDSVSVVFANSP